MRHETAAKASSAEDIATWSRKRFISRFRI
jgi:hypothetical protein